MHFLYPTRSIQSIKSNLGCIQLPYVAELGALVGKPTCNLISNVTKAGIPNPADKTPLLKGFGVNRLQNKNHLLGKP